MAARTSIEITDEIAQILQRSLLDGWSLHLPPNLGSMHKPVDRVLRAAGACWNRTQQVGPSGLKGAYIVHQDTMQKLQMALVDGKIVVVPTTKVLPTESEEPLLTTFFTLHANGPGIYHYGQ